MIDFNLHIDYKGLQLLGVIKKLFFQLLLICIFTGPVFAQSKNPDAPWFFIHITDPQFGMFDNNEGFGKETILYEKAVTEINRLKPEFVVITGDFVHNQHSLEQIQEFNRVTAQIRPEIPVYYTPGNHDIGLNPDKRSLKEYKRRYGKDRFAFEHNGSFFIGFNTSLIKAALHKAEQKQYKWLRSKLQKGRKADHIILFCHYPFFNKDADEPESYSNIGPAFRQKYLSLFEELNVRAVFSGHYHNNALSTYGNIQLVTTSAAGKPLGGAPSGMRIIKMFKESLAHEYYGFDDLPEIITYDY